MTQFTLRTLFLLITLLAGAVWLLIHGGWYVVASTLVIGVVIGACISFLLRRSKLGTAPLVAALAAAIASEIVGIYVVDFRVEDWHDLSGTGSLPYGLDHLFWFAFCGAFFGAALGFTVGKWRRSRAKPRRSPSETQRRIAIAALVATRTTFWTGIAALLLCPLPLLPVGIAIALAAMGLLSIAIFALGFLTHLTFAIRLGPKQRTDEHEANGAPRLFQFTLRRVFVVITLSALAIVFAPKLWDARITAPRRISVQMPGTLDLAGTTIQLPIKPESVQSYYVMDGGTYGVRFVDDAGVVHVVGSWRPLGQPEHHGEIIIGGMTPDSGGKNVGKIELAQQLIFSAMELEDQSCQSEPTTMDAVYSTYGLLFKSVFRELGYRTGMW